MSSCADVVKCFDTVDRGVLVIWFWGVWGFLSGFVRLFFCLSC